MVTDRGMDEENVEQGWVCSSVGELLPGTGETFGSILSTAISKFKKWRNAHMYTTGYYLVLQREEILSFVTRQMNM